MNRCRAYSEVSSVRVTKVFENMVHMGTIHGIANHAHTLSSAQGGSVWTRGDASGPQLENLSLSDKQAAMLSSGIIYH